MNKILRKLYELACCIAVGGFMSLIILPMAYEDRGYLAFGGEWFLIFGLMILTYILVHENKNIDSKKTGGKNGME
jgi:hypothetical protein